MQTFGLVHAEIGAKIGRSREYVSNSIRLLALAAPIQQAVVDKQITEGHARALLMLQDRPQEQETLFKEIMLKKTSVRVVEQLARRIATDKIRKHDKTPELRELEKSLTETLGTRVLIESRPKGGRVLIEFFSPEDLSHIVAALAAQQASTLEEQMAQEEVPSSEVPITTEVNTTSLAETEPNLHPNTSSIATAPPAKNPEDDLYSVRNFSV